MAVAAAATAAAAVTLPAFIVVGVVVAVVFGKGARRGTGDEKRPDRVLALWGVWVFRCAPKEGRVIRCLLQKDSGTQNPGNKTKISKMHT